MMGFWDGSGISWTICKQSTSRSRQITTPTPHQLGRMPFLMANQQYQSTEGRRHLVHMTLGSYPHHTHCLSCEVRTASLSMSESADNISTR